MVKVHFESQARRELQLIRTGSAHNLNTKLIHCSKFSRTGGMTQEDLMQTHMHEHHWQLANWSGKRLFLSVMFNLTEDVFNNTPKHWRGWVKPLQILNLPQPPY